MNTLTPNQLVRLFETLHAKILVLKPGTYEIKAVSDSYLKATMTRKENLVGKTLFEIFPDNPDEPGADGTLNLSRSLSRATTFKAVDNMGIQRYPIRQPDGTFVERYWSAVNSPVLGENDEVDLIVHRVEDVTDLVKGSSASEVSADPIDLQDIVHRTDELKQAVSKLHEYEVRLRTAEHLLKLGTWEFDFNTGTLSWSRHVFEMYDVPLEQGSPDLDGYFDGVHPDDRVAARAVFDEFVATNALQLEFEHRILTRDGRVQYIKGVGGRHRTKKGEIVVGYVQDVTSFIRTQDQLSQAEQLLRLAGEKVQLGGWRVDLEAGSIFWTAETAAIHGYPPDYSPPSVAEAIEFYAPEYRKLVGESFERCVQQGETFDIVCQLITKDGRRPWVRAIGEAECDEDGKTVAVQGAFQDITPLREAQQQAAESERLRVDVMESISDGFFTLDDKSIFTYVNHQATIMMGRPADELLGQSVWAVFPHVVDSPFYVHYEQFREARETVRFQEVSRTTGRWYDVNMYPIPEGLAVYFRDVTQEREKVERLRLADAALSRLNDIVLITDADHLDAPDGPRIVYANDAFERLTGYEKQAVMGLTPRILQGPDTDRQELDRIRIALEQREPVRSEVLNYAKDGGTYWLELDVTPLFDDDGRCTHFVAVERDITERKKQQDALRTSQERFQLISKAASDVIRDWDLNTDDVWWNDSMTKVFGYPLDELETGSTSWTHHIHPEDQERVLDSIQTFIAGNEHIWRGEYRFMNSDGDPVHVMDRTFIIRDADGQGIRMVGSMVDLSEQRAMEQKLREAQKLEAVGHLTGGVAHDFNNLLTIILGSAEMLEHFSTDPKLKSMAGMTVSAAKRGAELTSRLLAFARRQPLNPKPTNVNALLDEMRPLIRRTLPESMDIEFKTRPDVGIVEVDSGELNTALLNLVINARDAMVEKGKLTIETANAILDSDYAENHSEVTPGKYVMISVSDTGTGMDAATIRQAVEPFFTTKDVGKGSGLGLSMVFGFTKQSGGHIKIYSEVGEGTSVKLYFPRIQSSGEAESRSEEAASIIGGTEHILLAEDDELVLAHLERQLKMLGYRVTTAVSGPDALRKLEQHADVDLLLTDIIMPGGMNGRELAEKACEIQPGIRILYTSGYSENAIVHHGRLDKGVDLLSKPYTYHELASKVRQVLDRDLPA